METEQLIISHQETVQPAWPQEAGFCDTCNVLRSGRLSSAYQKIERLHQDQAELESTQSLQEQLVQTLSSAVTHCPSASASAHPCRYPYSHMMGPKSLSWIRE